jgi:bacterial/archaeal transporter family-2 protein
MNRSSLPVSSRAVSGNAFAVALSLVAGVAGAAQVAINGAFGQRIGTLEATAFNLFVSAIILAGVVLAARASFGGVVEGVRQPAWLWLGGVAGAIIVGTITFAGPRIGALVTVALLIAGQLAMGVVIDQFGLFGAERITVTPTRLAGVVILAVGAVLVLRGGR